MRKYILTIYLVILGISSSHLSICASEIIIDFKCNDDRSGERIKAHGQVEAREAEYLRGLSKALWTGSTPCRGHCNHDRHR